MEVSSRHPLNQYVFYNSPMQLSADDQNDAPGYEDIIKRPMSIRTVRTRIREGQITTIDEFERDVMLIFAYVPFFLTGDWF
jgi:bromodomain-containing protein 8